MEGVQIARENHVDFLQAVGGGSCCDSWNDVFCGILTLLSLYYALWSCKVPTFSVSVW